MTVSPAASTTTALPMFGDHLKPHLFWATYRFPDGSNATWEAERRCFENTKSLPFLSSGCCCCLRTVVHPPQHGREQGERRKAGRGRAAVKSSERRGRKRADSKREESTRAGAGGEREQGASRAGRQRTGLKALF